MMILVIMTGVTYNWGDKWSAISACETTIVDNIADDSIKTAIKGASGFSTNVMTKAVDLISLEVSNHHQQVAYLSYALSEKLQLPLEEKQTLVLSALLHAQGHIRRGVHQEGSRHGIGDGLGVIRLKIHIHQSGDTLRHGLGGDNDDVLFRQSGALLGGHDDVAVVGQDKHGLGGDGIHAVQNALGGGVHARKDDKVLFGIR